jgi:hypothetical protein
VEKIYDHLLLMNPNKLAYVPSYGQDELLSSFLARVVFAHCSTPHRFLNLFWPNRPIWNRDIDRDPDAQWLVDVASLMGLTPEEIEGLTLREHRRALVSAKEATPGDTPFLLSVGVFHRKRRLHGLQYCPLCLGEGPAYFRREWRLTFIVGCDRHKVPLRDACPHCDAIVMPHRLAKRGLEFCYSCGKNIAESSAAELIKKDAIEFQRKLFTHLRRVEPSQPDPAGDIGLTDYRTLVAVTRSKVVHQALRE